MNEPINPAKFRVAVVGLGTEGLEIAVNVASKGAKVWGIDSDPEKIEILKNGSSYVPSISTSTIDNLISNGRLSVTDKFSELPEIDHAIICIPAPRKPSGECNTDHLLSQCRLLAPHLKPGAIFALGPLDYPEGLEERIARIVGNAVTVVRRSGEWKGEEAKVGGLISELRLLTFGFADLWLCCNGETVFCAFDNPVPCPIRPRGVGRGRRPEAGSRTSEVDSRKPVEGRVG